MNQRRRPTHNYVQNELCDDVASKLNTAQINHKNFNKYKVTTTNKFLKHHEGKIKREFKIDKHSQKFGLGYHLEYVAYKKKRIEEFLKCSERKMQRHYQKRLRVSNSDSNREPKYYAKLWSDTTTEVDPLLEEDFSSEEDEWIDYGSYYENYYSTDADPNYIPAWGNTEAEAEALHGDSEPSWYDKPPAWLSSTTHNKNHLCKKCNKWCGSMLLYGVCHESIINENYVRTSINKECCICLSTIEEIYAMYPCGHTSTCLSCINSVTNNICPICRIPYEEYRRIFL